MKRIFLVALLAILSAMFHLSTAAAHNEKPRLDDVFGDHMVLQRDHSIALRGQASAGQSVSVGLAGHERSAVADSEGRWRVDFDAMAAGGPHTITLDGDVVARDVLVGDVFLCSGQSNMEYQVHLALNPHREIPSSFDPEIRLLTVPKGSALVPRLEFEFAASWEIASPETVPEFSAVCYFTARDLKADAGVPIGLVEASWGGSRIEAWMSFEALEKFPAFAADLDLLKAYREDARAGLSRFGQTWESWWRRQHPGQPEIWSDSGSLAWTPVPETFGSWKTWGTDDLANYDGQLWFRTEFEVEEGSALSDTVPDALSLAALDETDLVWINGRFIGTQFGWATYRLYDLPAGVVRIGKNQILVNVASTWDDGGFLGPAEDIYLAMSNGERLPLEGWEYFKPDAAGLDAPRTPWQSIFGLTGMYNAMLAPLRDLRFRGAIWYQGESNTGNAEPYEGLLDGLVDDWQRLAGIKVPVIVIQLPEFGSASDVPIESGWVRLRESQRRVAASRLDVELVVTLGAGDPYDVHPPNKQEVARRTADAARRLFYGQNVADTNRDPTRALKRGDEVVVALSGPDRSLKTWSADRAFGLELCAASTCRFVSGAVDGARIVIEIPEGFDPDRVRYNWSDWPQGNLADESGRPVVPFEIAIE